MVVSIIMLVSGYNNIILLPNCTLLYYVFSGPLSLCASVPEIKFNNNIILLIEMVKMLMNYCLHRPTVVHTSPAGVYRQVI